MMSDFNKLLLGLSLLCLVACDSSDPGPQINCAETGPLLSLSSTPTSTCVSADGTITAEVAVSEDGLVYSLDGGVEQDNGLFEELVEGTYTVEVKNSDGCTDSKQIVIRAAAPTINLASVSVLSTAGCQSSNGSLSISATGEGKVLYSASTSSIPNFQSNSQISGLPAGEYIVTVKDDNGCTEKTTAKILNGTSYSTEVQPIILANCAIKGCHNGDNGDLKDWTVFSNVKDRADAIKSRTQSGSMPPKGKPQLTSGEIALIGCWVDDGARNN